VFGATIGRCGDGRFEIDRDVVVATAAMLHARMDRAQDELQKFGVLIIDESHHLNEAAMITPWVGGNTWYRIAMSMDARRRFAFTGTVPSEGTVHRMAIEGITDRVIHSILPTELMDGSVLSGLSIVWIKIPRRERLFEWDKIKSRMVRDVERNALIVEKALEYQEQGRSVLVFVDRIEHGELLASMIQNSVFVRGETDTVGRDEAVKALSSKDKVVIGTIFGEGFDLPNLDVAINACGGRSAVKVIQQCGRVVRAAVDKVEGVLVDCLDSDGGGILSRQSTERKRLYRKYFGEVFKEAGK